MNILFLCTSNLNRSRTAEDLFKTTCATHQYKSAGLSHKYCLKHGTTLCTIELLAWADRVFVMEDMHVQRITEHAGEAYLSKTAVLNIEDVYRYMQPELIEKLMANDKLRFLNK